MVAHDTFHGQQGHTVHWSEAIDKQIKRIKRRIDSKKQKVSNIVQRQLFNVRRRHYVFHS